MRTLVLVLAAAGLLVAQGGKIVRPSDGAAIVSGPLDIAARAPGGWIELDGKPVDAEQPFPDVFRARIDAVPGEHVVSLIWEGGREDIRIWAGANPPGAFTEFRQHPPLDAIECAQCHGVSRRGRFRFRGGCESCHAKEEFVKTHPHPMHVLEDCGQCHNAHGSTTDALLVHPRETACRLCHGL